LTVVLKLNAGNVPREMVSSSSREEGRKRNERTDELIPFETHLKRLVRREVVKKERVPKQVHLEEEWERREQRWWRWTVEEGISRGC